MKNLWLKKAADEKKRVTAIRDSFATVRKRQKDNAGKIPHLEERKARLQEVREYSVGNRELLEESIESLRSNGVDVRLAQTQKEALSLIREEIGDERLIIKSKSNTTKEIELTGQLEERGIEAIETDIGDRIIQIAGDKPSHHTGPASHLSKERIAEILSSHFGYEIPSDPTILTQILRDEIAQKIEVANIGITGANAITAEEGAILFVHNEGNITEVVMRPKKHIILAGIDKIYPNAEEALNMAKLQTYYATGALIPSFINFMSGPSKTADIEKKLIKGVHGPKSISLILIDNGRSEIAKSDFRELLYCIGCGECLLQCPAYYVYGNKFSSAHNLGGRGVLYSTLAEGIGTKAHDELYTCVTCGRCRKHCPVSIDTPKLVTKLRHQYPTLIPELHIENAYRFIESHLKLLLGAVRIEALALLATALRVKKE
ncbi:MAG: LUD domain-containing protein [Thermodesulfobacteriota bacterium]|nr:LUD domain-containing protein [Thermodesulfobacteriota bacterium]